MRTTRLPKTAFRDRLRHGGADVAARSGGVARPARADDPRRRRRHRADADDEGRRVPADAAWSACTASSRNYARIAVTASGELRIGAMATLSELEHDANVAARLPVLTRALRTLSNPRVRNVARVGGALAHGDPHMDLPPVLAALGARVAISGPQARARIAARAALRRLLRNATGEERTHYRGNGAET